jgi:ATP-binding cassette subfamily F protein uup
LDEPTNDLDAETLELLEERLMEYSGTILLVSHDRTFLNNVVTSTIVLEGNGRLQEYVGGYDDWLRQKGAADKAFDKTSGARKEQKVKKEKAPREKSKLSFKETRELEDLPQKIESMEKAKSELLALLNSPELYRSIDPSRVKDANEKLQTLEADLTAAYTRWEELEEMAAAFGYKS